jgi:hypothetical protein
LFSNDERAFNWVPQELWSMKVKGVQHLSFYRKMSWREVGVAEPKVVVLLLEKGCSILHIHADSRCSYFWAHHWSTVQGAHGLIGIGVNGWLRALFWLGVLGQDLLYTLEGALLVFVLASEIPVNIMAFLHRLLIAIAFTNVARYLKRCRPALVGSLVSI